MSFIRALTDPIFNELKAIIREYTHETEAMIKKRLKRMLITGIIIAALSSLMITFLGSASILLEIGGLKYQMLSMPAWEAFDVMALTSALIGVLFFLGLYLVIRKQFGP